MGFMDKAKKMAEQAQAKLDEAQKQFNAGQQPGQQSGPAVEYDEHGRPIPQTPAESGVPPHGDPLASSPPPPTPGVPPTGQEEPPAGSAPEPPPVAQPGVPPTAAEPYSPPAPEAAAPPAAEPYSPPPAPSEAPAPDAPPARPEADAADEDRNNPSYAPPKLSSGDPLAG
jgi:hypothetical protein